jgi:hypothetical protein
MNQARSVMPELLATCIAGACAGLLIGALLPTGRITQNIGIGAGPGQSALIGGALGVLFGAVFFFAKDNAGEGCASQRLDVLNHAKGNIPAIPHARRRRRSTACLSLS